MSEPTDPAETPSPRPSEAAATPPSETPVPLPAAPVPTWEDLGLFESTLAQIRAAGWKNPTPIQSGVIPHAVKGRDVIGAAQTGTGKTAAFMIPIVEQLALAEGETARPMGGPSALILAPTRELAAQIAETARVFTPGTGLGSALVVGGVPMDAQYYALDGTAQILIATPGRVCDHLMRGSLKLHTVEILVLDEADRMLDMGFEVQLERIVGVCPRNRQTMMFSATMPPGVEKMSHAALHDPVRIEVARPGIAAKKIEQRFIECDARDKDQLLVEILRDEPGTCIVFAGTKLGCNQVGRMLMRRRINCERLHGNREQSERDAALDAFKSGKVRVLVATDVAARGLDVNDIAHVINYDLPYNAEDYVHRIGRTGRVDKSGRATTFVTSHPADRRKRRLIEQILGGEVTLGAGPGMRRIRGAPSAPAEGTDSRSVHGNTDGGNRRRGWRDRGRGRSERDDAPPPPAEEEPIVAAAEPDGDGDDASGPIETGASGGPADPRKRKRRRRGRRRGRSGDGADAGPASAPAERAAGGPPPAAQHGATRPPDL